MSKPDYSRRVELTAKMRIFLLAIKKVINNKNIYKKKTYIPGLTQPKSRTSHTIVNSSLGIFDGTNNQITTDVIYFVSIENGYANLELGC